MAKKNATSKKAVKIPASERRAVTVLRAFMVSDGEKNVTDEKAYQRLLRGRKEVAAKLAKEQAAKKKELEARRREKREQAIETIGREIMHLACVRDLLERMEAGEDDHFCAETNATFARAALQDASTEMELALFDLGVLKRGQFSYFAPDLPSNPEAQEASHG